MREKNKSIVIDGVTEIDDLTLVSHFAQTESNKIQELKNFKRNHSGQVPKNETQVSQFYNETEESEGSDSDTEVLNDVLSPKNSQTTDQVHYEPKDPLDDLMTIDTVDLPDKVSDEFPICKIGKCKSVFEEILIIESLRDSKVLDLGSIVCKMDRTILGTVNDTFGQTTCPYYMVILRNKGLKVEMEEYVYCDVKHSTYVTDQNVYSVTQNNNEESEDENVEEFEKKTHNKLKQSYKDL